MSRSREISSSAANGSSINSRRGSVASARGNRDPHLHAARELPRVGARRVAESDQLKQLGHPRPPRLLRHTLQLQLQSNVVLDRAPGQQRRVLEDERDGPARLRLASARRPTLCPAVGVARPATSFRMVDLPQPDGPMRLTNSPGSTARLMRATTAFVRVSLREVRERDMRSHSVSGSSRCDGCAAPCSTE